MIGSPSQMNYGKTTTVFASIAICLVVIITLMGNALVAVAVFTVRKLRHPPNFLLVSLAVSDFCVGLFVIPLAGLQQLSGSWNFGVVLCDLWCSFDVLLCTASILNLCAVSVDRYLAITKPLKYGPRRTTKTILSYIGVVWVLAFFISVVPVFLRTPTNQTANLTECEVIADYKFQLFATLGAFYIPVAIMLIVNFKIFRAAKKMAAKENLGSVKSSRGSSLVMKKLSVPETLRACRFTFKDGLNSLKRSSLLRRLIARLNTDAIRETRAARTLSIVMGAFIICWLPFFIVALIKPWGDEKTVPEWLDLLTLWLGYANSAINPGLYALFNRDFRVPFREILCCRCSNMKTVIRSEAFMYKFGDNSNETCQRTQMPIVSPVTDETPVEQTALHNCSDSCGSSASARKHGTATAFINRSETLDMRITQHHL